MPNQIPLDYRTPAAPEPRRRMSPVARRRWVVTVSLFLLLLIIISAFSIQQERERARQRLAYEQAQRELAPHAWHFAITGAGGRPFEFVIDMRTDDAALRRKLRLYFFVIERQVAEYEKSPPAGGALPIHLGTFHATLRSSGISWGPFDLVALNTKVDTHRYGVRRSGPSAAPTDSSLTPAGMPDADDINTLIDSIISTALDEWRIFEPRTRPGTRTPFR